MVYFFCEKLTFVLLLQLYKKSFHETRTVTISHEITGTYACEIVFGMEAVRVNGF